MVAAKGALAAIGQVHWDRGALAAPQFGGGDRQVYASQASFEKRRPRFRFSGTKGMVGVAIEAANVESLCSRH